MLFFVPRSEFSEIMLVHTIQAGGIGNKGEVKKFQRDQAIMEYMAGVIS